MTYEAATRYLQAKEKEIAYQTTYINAVGVEKVAERYMNDYFQNLRLWDEVKAIRDGLKPQA